MGKSRKRSDERRELSAAVLAGGLSSRMGSDKAFVEFGGRPLVRHALERVGAVSDDVFVVAKVTERLEELGVRVVGDRWDVRTPLAGIATAQRAARHPFVFVCACDMPFVSPDVVRLLLRRVEGADAAVPLRNGRPEPSHAVWATSAADALEAALQDGERAVHRALKGMRVAWVSESEWSSVDPKGRTFVNLNTPEDLARAAR